MAAPAAKSVLMYGNLYNDRGVSVHFETAPNNDREHIKSMDANFCMAVKPKFHFTEPMYSFKKGTAPMKVPAIDYQDDFINQEYLCHNRVRGYNMRDNEMKNLPVQINNDPPIDKEPRWTSVPEGNRNAQTRGIRYNGWEAIDFWKTPL